MPKLRFYRLLQWCYSFGKSLHQPKSYFSLLFNPWPPPKLKQKKLGCKNADLHCTNKYSNLALKSKNLHVCNGFCSKLDEFNSWVWEQSINTIWNARSFTMIHLETYRDFARGPSDLSLTFTILAEFGKRFDFQRSVLAQLLLQRV